ncbi:cell division protein FtsQ/DivIB [Nocardioides pacificus]
MVRQTTDAPRTKGGVDPGTARSRRRFERRQRARRWRLWRVVVAVVGVLTLVALTLWLVLYSSVLAVQGVRVEGNDLLDDDVVRRAAAVPDGEPLARLDVDAIRSRVAALAAVRSVDVSREWPDGVLVRVVEREAIAVVPTGNGLRGMDEEGVLFRDFARAPGDLPRVQLEAGIRSEAMLEAALVISALPVDLVADVDHVEVATVDQIVLQLRDGRTVDWGSAEQSVDKARVLDALLEAREARHYDVSVPGQPTTSGE